MTTSPYRLSPEVLEVREREHEERLVSVIAIVRSIARHPRVDDAAAREFAEDIAAVLIPEGHEVRPVDPR